MDVAPKGRKYRIIGRIGTLNNHSYFITLPIKQVRALHLYQGQRVMVEAKDGGLFIRLC